MCTLEKLQKAITEHLRGMGELRFADISAEALESNNLNEKAEGMKIKIKSPIPKKASKYAAGPTFSEVEISVEIKRFNEIAKRALSLLSAAEIVSRTLHLWTPPLDSGYGKLALAESSPWKNGDYNAVLITFQTQSVLQ